MIKKFALAGAMLALVPAAISGAFAHTAHRSAKSAAMYHCAKCHMKFTAAKAKADHFKDPMDGGMIVPDIAAKAHSGSMKMKSAPMDNSKMKSGSMGGMKM